MEFNIKLQNLRKQKGITQDELAAELFVSRAAVSKWESGRGYPNIESLKQIAKFYSLSLDELLSGEELLTVAEEETKRSKKYFCDLIFGLLDIGAALLLFMPLLANRVNGVVLSVSLLNLTGVSTVISVLYFAIVIGLVFWGILTLVLQNFDSFIWQKSKCIVSLILNAVGTLVFIISLQVYAAILLFLFLMVKTIICIKR